MTPSTPEQRERANIDRLLELTGWVAGHVRRNVHAGSGVAQGLFEVAFRHLMVSLSNHRRLAGASFDKLRMNGGSANGVTLKRPWAWRYGR